MTIDEIKNHPWFKNDVPTNEEVVAEM